MTNRRLPKIQLKVSLVLLAVGACGFVTALALGQHLLVLVSLLMAVVGVLLGKTRLLCPECGKGHLAIGADVSHCHHCGASYFPETRNSLQ